MAGHGRDFPRGLVRANLDYVRRLARVPGSDDAAGWSEEVLARHRRNAATAAGAADQD